MSPGLILLVGILGTFSVLVGLQWAMGRMARKAEGREAPGLGALGDPEGRLVWFHGPGCAPCRAMRPDVDALGERVIAVDVSQHFEIAQAYGVMATPTTILVRGGQIASVRPGRMSRDGLEGMLAG